MIHLSTTKIVEIGHARNKPCVPHSRGKYEDFINNVIDDMKFGARHSYEDSICPVEKVYEELVGRIAVLGGIDVDSMARIPAEMTRRAEAMLDKSLERGGYMLGTDNSVPNIYSLKLPHAYPRGARLGTLSPRALLSDEKIIAAWQRVFVFILFLGFRAV